MSTMMRGLIEVRKPDGTWGVAIFDAGELATGQSYDAYACLFGVRNYAQFKPVVGNRRGLPKDVSDKVSDFVDICDGYMFSWITYGEVLSIDKEELNEGDDQRADVWVKDHEGKLIGFLGDIIQEFNEFKLMKEKVEAKGEVEIGGGRVAFLKKKIKRGEVLGLYDEIFKAMADLSETHGADGVRLIVAFD